MKTIGNILWLFLTGIGTAISWFFIGVIWCITIIGIPFGKQAFKLARVSAWPFGTTVRTNFGAHPIANVLWIVLGGIGLAMSYLFLGIFWCITIIGIPFGKQCFKLASVAIAPFGCEIG